MKVATFSFLYAEQIITMLKKCVGQRRRAGRSFLRETAMRQFFFLGFIDLLLYILITSTAPPLNTTYQKHALPPLSTKGKWAMFDSNSTLIAGSNQYYSAVDLYYSPNNHAGVTNLMNALKAEYPSVNIIGAVNPSDVQSLYQGNLFNTLGALQFNLTSEQVQTGKLVTSQTLPSTVFYTILINPIIQTLPTDNIDYSVLNDWPCLADTWWRSGYMTIQNFVGTYLAQQYDFVPSNYEVKSARHCC